MQAIHFPAIPSIPDLSHAFSSARIAPYLNASDRDSRRAAATYYWNARLGQSLWWPLHVLEVLVRNSLCRALSDKYGVDWLSSPKFLTHLHLEADSALVQAKRRMARWRAGFSMEWIIPDLSFGFWVSLLSQRYHVPFGWHRRLPLAFPAAPAGASPGKVHQTLDEIRLLRNRIAHNEPIYYKDLLRYYTNILYLIGWMSPPMKNWVNDTSDFLVVWEARPR